MTLPKVIDRRFKLTEERAEKICAAISEGHTRSYAAGFAGISERSLYNYLQMSDEALGKFEDGDELTEPEAFLAQFALSLQIARGTAEKKYLDIIKGAATTQWQAAAWIMERSLGWTKTQKVEVSGERVLKVKLSMGKPHGAEIMDNAPEAQDEIVDADYELLGDEDEEHAA